MKISIIGSSQGVTKDMFYAAGKKMAEAVNIVTASNAVGNILKSGGSSGIDHIVVVLFLENPERFNLVLHLPCGFDNGFYSVGRYDRKAANTLNDLHRDFSKIIGRNTIKDIADCINHPPGKCRVTSSEGFFARNDLIAITDTLLAMSHPKGNQPGRGGGTHYTWNAYKGANKHYLSLSEL